MPKECYYFRFGLFVTGEGEEEHLPKLFSALSQSGICSFYVKRRIPQLRPITSKQRKARMVRTGQIIPDKNFNSIAVPARRYLQADKCNRVILIDDLEWSDKWEPQQMFERYRSVLDAGLSATLKHKASVHFLVIMLEAYFFAHPDALNHALNLAPPVAQHDGDVETIRNPKSRLRQLFPDYNERDHAGLILDRLDLDIVLSNPECCSSLRTCVKWIVDQLKAYPDQETFNAFNFDERFHLQEGQLYPVTADQ